MTPLEQFNKKMMKEMNKKIVPATVRKFFLQKLTEQKELILKMVREKAPKIKITGEGTYCQTCKQHKAAGECDCVGFNKGVQEFLNNLDTI